MVLVGAGRPSAEQLLLNHHLRETYVPDKLNHRSMRLPSLRTLVYPTRSPQVHTVHRRNVLDTLRRSWAGSSTHRAFNTSDCTANQDEEDYDFGSFDVILPKEPYVWGVSHIQPRPVPPHIARPPYARGEPINTSIRDKLVHLGSDDERGLRDAALLARDVLQFAGSLIEVRV